MAHLRVEEDVEDVVIADLGDLDAFLGDLSALGDLGAFLGASLDDESLAFLVAFFNEGVPRDLLEPEKSVPEELVPEHESEHESESSSSEDDWS